MERTLAGGSHGLSAFAAEKSRKGSGRGFIAALAMRRIRRSGLFSKGVAGGGRGGDEDGGENPEPGDVHGKCGDAGVESQDDEDGEGGEDDGVVEETAALAGGV